MMEVSFPNRHAELARVSGHHTPETLVADLAKRLDESGDAKNQAGTESNFKKLQGILKTIASLYPPDALKR